MTVSATTASRPPTMASTVGAPPRLTSASHPHINAILHSSERPDINSSYPHPHPHPHSHQPGPHPQHPEYPHPPPPPLPGHPSHYNPQYPGQRSQSLFSHATSNQRQQYHHHDHHHHLSSTLPTEAHPRTLSRYNTAEDPTAAYDHNRRQHQHPQQQYQVELPSSIRYNYQVHQSSYPRSASSSFTSAGSHQHGRTLNHEEVAPMSRNSYSNISSNLPEYSFPGPISQRFHRERPEDPIQLQQQHHHHHQQQQHHHYRQQLEHEQPHQRSEHERQGHSHHDVQNPDTRQPYESPQQQERSQSKPSFIEQPHPYHQHHHQRQQDPTFEQQRFQPPPPIRTKWSGNTSSTFSEYPPPLSYPSRSSHSLPSARNAESRISPATPRSSQVPRSILSDPGFDLSPHVFTESPLDYRPPSLRYRVMVNSADLGSYNMHKRDEEMEFYSERDDVHERELENCEEEEEDEEDLEGQEDEDYMAMDGHAKKQKVTAGDARPPSFGRPLPWQTSMQKDTGMEEGGHGEEDRHSSNRTSTASSRKQSVSGSVHADERPASSSKSKKSLKSSTAEQRDQRHVLTQSKGFIGDVLELIEDDAQPDVGPQSFTGRGLRIYAQRVCERVKAKGSTSCNELVHELFGGKPGEYVEDAPEEKGQENIRRRVYDALNVLKAVGIISFDNKDIHWVGIEQSVVVKEVTRRKEAAEALLHGHRLPEDGGGAEESEEPEDDDMEIEKLQREINAMKLRNELEQAKLQDQLTRHVQVLNLVKRNKQSEAKDEKREEKRRQRKESGRTRVRSQDQDQDHDPSMTDVGPQGYSDHNEEMEPRRRPDRHQHRRRSPRLASDKSERTDDAEDDHEDDYAEGEEEEEARRRRKQERRERRDRKEKKRAERKLEKDHDRFQLPLLLVRMPGYTGQSSDSESSISVVRRVREDQKLSRSGKSKSMRRCEPAGHETTMVEIHIPQQDELSIISDTEILADLGLNAVSMDDLESMLPRHLIDAVQYSVQAEERQRSSRSQRCVRSSEMSLLVNEDGEDVTNAVAVREHAADPTCVTVQGGFEREIVRATTR